MKKIMILVLSIFVIVGGIYIVLGKDNEIDSNDKEIVIENDNVAKEEAGLETEKVEEIPQEELDKYVRYGNQGSIDIGVLFKNPVETNDEYLIFEIMLNNHSFDVSNIDYSKLVTLRTDTGIELSDGFTWTVAEGSGHHVFGTLELPIKYDGEDILNDTTQYIELELRAIDENLQNESSKFLWERDDLKPIK